MTMTVPVEEMRTATEDQNLSLTDFCKLNNLPKTTVLAILPRGQHRHQQGAYRSC